MTPPTDLQQLPLIVLQPVLMGWAIAVPLIASAISGVMQARANKKMARPLSDEGIQESSNKYFPGLFSAKGTWNSNAMANPIQTRAEGGPVQPGTPYLVGEKGPEVIQPTAPGVVIPNQASAPPTPQTPSGPTTPIATAGAPAPVPAPTNPSTLAMPAPASPALPGGQAQQAPDPNAATTLPGSRTPGAPEGQDGAPAPGSATVQTPTQAGGQTAGSLIVQHMLNYLSNPGELSPAAYERKQEQAMQGYGQAVRGIGGTLSTAGINPNSGFGQMLGQSAALNAMKLRNEANRDFTMASEQLKREDIKTATDSYLKFLETLFGLGSQRANNLLGIDLGGPARAVGVAGQTLGTYFSDREKAQAAEPNYSSGPQHPGPSDSSQP